MQVAQNLSDVIRLFKMLNKKTKALTFLACLDSLGGLVGRSRSLAGGFSEIRQDAVYSHHLGFNQRTDGR